MSKFNGTKLLTVSLDMDTFNKLKVMKGKKTWEEFFVDVSNMSVVA